MYLTEDRKEYWNSSIANLTVKSDITWFPNPQNTFTAGISIGGHGLDAGKITVGDQSVADPYDVPEYHNNEFVLYAGNEQKIADKLILRYGIRLPKFLTARRSAMHSRQDTAGQHSSSTS